MVVPLPEVFGGQYLSGDGEFVAGVYDPGFSAVSSSVARWSLLGGIEGIAPFEFDPVFNEFGGGALAISSDGDRVMLYLPSFSTGSGLWDAGVGLTALQEFAGAGTTYANRMSGDGNTVMGFTTMPRESIVWSGGGAPTLLCGAGCGFTASSVSEDGLSAVGYLFGNAMGLADGLYLWQSALGFTLIGTTFPFQSFLDLSADGTTVVGLGSGGSIFRWTASTGVTAISPPAGWDEVEVPKVNGTGDRIVARLVRFGGGPDSVQAGVWTTATGWAFLKDYLISKGATGFADPTTAIDSREFSSDGNAVLGFVRYAGRPEYRRSVIYFDQATPGTIGSGFCGPQPIGANFEASTLFATGSDNVAANDLHLSSTGVPFGVFGFVLSSRGQGLIANPGGALGNLCLGGGSPIGRHNRAGEIQNSGSTATFDWTMDLTDFPTTSGTASVQVGETWNFQVWHRDGSGSNFTPAVSILFQ